MNLKGSKCDEDVEYPTCKWGSGLWCDWIKQEAAYEDFYCEACVESAREKVLDKLGVDYK